MDRDQVATWLERYVAAWKSYEREAIVALFAEDVVYRYRPHEEPLRGRDAVADDWLGDRDEAGTYDAAYEPVAVDGDVAVATGTSTYTDPGGSVRAVYDNCFVLRFGDAGLCTEFTEWFSERPNARSG